MRAPNRAPAGDSPPIVMRGAGVGTGNAYASWSVKNRPAKDAGPPVNSNRSTLTASSRRATRSGGSGHSMP